MRTGARSAPPLSLDFGTVRRACSCAPSISSGGIVQVASVAEAASVWATNSCSIDGPSGSARSSSAAAAEAVVSRRRRILFLLRLPAGIEVFVGAVEDFIDHQLDPRPWVGRVLLHIVSGRVDAGNLRPPVFREQLVGVAVPRG